MLESAEGVWRGSFQALSCHPSDGGDEPKHTGDMVQSDFEGKATPPHIRSSLELVFAALFCSNPASAEVLFRDLQICQPIGTSGTVGQGVAISLSQEDELGCRHPLLCCIILAFVGFLLLQGS